MVRKLRDENLLRKHFYGYTHGEELNNCPQDYNSVEGGNRETASAIKRAWTSEEHGSQKSLEHGQLRGAGSTLSVSPSHAVGVSVLWSQTNP